SVAVHALKLKERVVGGDLETRDEFRRCLASPAFEKDFASERRHETPRSDEFLIRRRQKTDWGKLAFVAVSSQQGGSVALPTGSLVGRAAGLSLSGSEDSRLIGLLAGQDEKS